MTAQVTAQVAAFCREPQPAKAIMAELGLKHWKTFQANYLAPLMAMGVLERTIPEKPRSRLQRYRTTEQGLAMLKKGTTGAPNQGRSSSVTYMPRRSSSTGICCLFITRINFPQSTPDIPPSMLMLVPVT